MLHKSLVCLLTAGVAPLALLATQAAGQNAVPGPPASSAPAGVPVSSSTPAGNEGQIADIVVTANRQAQNLQKVSTSVTVVDGATISTQALTNVGQIFSNIPSVQATGQPGGFSIDVRGLGGDLPAGSTQGSVALVTDGVYNINSQSTAVGFFDVNRIEVLEGPQGTRFGPNADGGVAQVITNDPVLGAFHVNAALTAGNYNLFRGEAAFNIPITDTLALRVAGAAVSRGSYFTPKQGNNKAQSLRMKLLYEPSDKLTLKLTYELDHIGGTGNGSNTFPVFTDKVGVYSGDSINDHGDPWHKGPNSAENENHANITENTLIANGTYNFSPAVVLDVLGSYSWITGSETGSIYLPPWAASGDPAIAVAHEYEFDPFHQFTGEVRLHNGAGSRVQWDIGYYHWNYLEKYRLDAEFLSTPTMGNIQKIGTTTATNAIFGEATFPISDRFRVIGGLRQSFDHRTFNFQNGPLATNYYGINFSHFDYRGGFEYDLAPRSMLYFTASSGYRPGGLSAFNPVTQAPNSFKSEVNHAYELGIKNRFFDNRVQLNADVFYYDESNYQNLDKYSGFKPVEGGDPCHNGDTRAGCQTPTFGVQAHSLGVEVQVRANLTRDDIFTANGTYLHAIFNHKQGTCATVAAPSGAGCYDGYNTQDPSPTALQTPFFFLISGAVQPHSPKFSGDLSYQHIFRLNSGATVSIGGDAFYTRGYWVNPVEDADRYGYQPSYWLGNASATFTPASAHWSLTAWVRNIGDYAVKQSVLPAQSIGDPRTFGGTIGVKF